MCVKMADVGRKMVAKSLVATEKYKLGRVCSANTVVPT